jgi:hypothetical protein
MMIAVFDVCYFPELASEIYTQVIWLEILEVTPKIDEAAIIIIDNDLMVVKNRLTDKHRTARLSTVDEFFIRKVIIGITTEDLEARIDKHSPSELYGDPAMYQSKLHKLPHHNLTLRRMTNLC